MLGGAEFQRRMIERLNDEYAAQLKGLMLSKDWSDFAERRGRVKAVEKAIGDAHDIIKDMEGN